MAAVCDYATSITSGSTRVLLSKYDTNKQPLICSVIWVYCTLKIWYAHVFLAYSSLKTSGYMWLINI